MAQASRSRTNRVGGMFGLFFSAEKVIATRRPPHCDVGAVQPLLPRHAQARRVPRAVGVRGRLHVQRAHRQDIADTLEAARGALREAKG